jgi:hypothetical protein
MYNLNKVKLKKWEDIESAFTFKPAGNGGGWGKKEGFLCWGCQFGLSTPFRRLMKNLDNEWQRFTRTIY